MYLILSFWNGSSDFLSPEVDFQNKILLQKLQKTEMKTKHFVSSAFLEFHLLAKSTFFPFQLGMENPSFLETEDLVSTHAICHQLCLKLPGQDFHIIKAISKLLKVLLVLQRGKSVVVPAIRLSPTVELIDPNGRSFPSEDTQINQNIRK